MIDRKFERPRNDRGQFATAEEIEAAKLEKLDASMNKWLLTRLRGPNSKHAQLVRKFGFGTPKPQEK